MTNNITEELADFAIAAQWEALPATAKDQARNLLLDSVSCALAADLSEETPHYARFARAAGGGGATTVIGSRETLSPLGATLLNAYEITAATVCDTYVPAHVHITPEIVPPALAIAEQEGASGRDLLMSIAVGSEVAVRVASGLNYALAGPAGWHMPGIVGPFGAAAAVGRLTALTPLQQRNAFGLAGSQSAGTWASWGTPTVKFHQSRGAGSGLLAAILASTGFTASADILGHADGGTLKSYTPEGRPDAVVKDLGSHWEFEEIALRVWPGGTPIQATLTAVFDLIAQNDIDPDEIARVTIKVSDEVYEAHARFVHPSGTFEALLSFHFAVAAALRDQDFWLDSVAPDAVAAPGIADFIDAKITFEADSALVRPASIVTVAMKDGRTLSARADAAKGTSSNPAGIEDLSGKYRKCVDGRLGDAEASELLDLIVNLEGADDLGRFFELLRAPGDRRR